MIDNIICIIEELDKYSSLILIGVTMVYVHYTHLLSKETTRLREVETNPQMSLAFNVIPDYPLELVIKNIGKGSAHNITFDIDDKYNKFFKYDFKHTIHYFAPNQQIKIQSKHPDDFKKLSEETIILKVKYYTRANKGNIKKFIDDEFALNLKYLENTLVYNSEPLKSIATSIRTIEHYFSTKEMKEFFEKNKQNK